MNLQSVYFVPEKRSQLAAAQAVVEGGALKRAVRRAQAAISAAASLGDAMRSRPPRSREPGPLAWIDGNVAVLDCAPVDHLERLGRVSECARVGA